MLTTAIVLAAIVNPSVPTAVTVTRVKTFAHIRTTAIAASPKGAVFAVASEDNRVRIMDAVKLTSIHTLDGHPMTPYALAFSRDGKFLLTGDESARIWLWDVKTGKKIREFSRDRGHTRGIQAFAFAPNGKTFASVGKDDVIKIWNTSGGHPTNTIKGVGANFYGIAYLPSGGLVTGTLLEGMRLYAPKGFTLAATLKVGGGEGANEIATNKAGTLGFTAGRDGRVVVWDLKKRTKIGAIKAHSDWVLNIAIAPNGKIGASSASDGHVVVWDVKTLQPLATIPGRAFVDSVVAFTSDGRHILTTDASNALQIHSLSPRQNR